MKIKPLDDFMAQCNNFALEIEDTGNFYQRVADECKIFALSEDQMATIRRARKAARLSFELRGCTVSPSPNLIYSVAWYITQAELAHSGGPH